MLNVPGKPKTDIPVIGSKVPKPEEIVILSQPLLKATIKLGGDLKDVTAKWAISGDAGEIIKGVNVQADHLEILTTKEGCEQITKKLAMYQTVAPAMVEKKLDREADVDSKMMPVMIKSHYAELNMDGVKIEIYGDE